MLWTKVCAFSIQGARSTDHVPFELVAVCAEQLLVSVELLTEVFATLSRQRKRTSRCQRCPSVARRYTVMTVREVIASRPYQLIQYHHHVIRSHRRRGRVVHHLCDVLPQQLMKCSRASAPQTVDYRLVGMFRMITNTVDDSRLRSVLLSC